MCEYKLPDARFFCQGGYGAGRGVAKFLRHPGSSFK